MNEKYLVHIVAVAGISLRTFIWGSLWDVCTLGIDGMKDQ